MGKPKWMYYFITKKDEERSQKIRLGLWNADVGSDQYKPGEALAYQQAILSQYELYVEMADRVSARRGAANTFFLTLNTSVFSLVVLFWEHRPDAEAELLVFPLVALLTQCLAWFWLIRSYRQLNSAKWAVVGELERKLPALAWSDGEWKATGEGDDPGVYWPLTKVESIVPLVFAATYLGAFVVALVA